MARFEITAPDGSRYEITAPDGATEQDAIEYARKRFGGQKPEARPPRSFSPTTPMTTPDISGTTPLPPAVYDPRYASNTPYKSYPGLDEEAEASVQNAANNPFVRKAVVFQNALIPGANKLGAAVEAGIDTLTGTDRSFGDSFRRSLAKRNRLEDVIEGDFGITDAPFRSLGWMMGGAALKLPEAAVNSSRFIPEAQQFLNSVKESIRPAAAFGGAQGALDSRANTAGGVLSDTGFGLLGGGILGPAVPLAVNLLGQGGNKLGDVYRYMTGRGTAARENVGNNLDVWKEANIKPFAPALTDNPVLTTTAEKGAGSILGGSLRREAQGSIDDVLERARGMIKLGTNGASLNDVGEAIQGDLRRALLERSTPAGLLKSMPKQDLERITGPVGDLGFLPPRPVVEPIQPRQARPFRSEPIDPEAVPFERVNPREVKAPVQDAKYTQFDDIPIPEQYRAPLAAAERDVTVTDSVFAGLKAEFDGIAKRLGVPPETMFQNVQGLAKVGDRHHPAHDVYQRLITTFEDLQAKKNNLDQIKRAVDDARDAQWSTILLGEDARYRKQFTVDRQRYEQEVVAAQREASEINARRRAEALQRAQIEADDAARYKYEAEQARLKAEAERGTQRAQELADEQWQKDVINRPGLNPDNTRDSYPTVFDAAYELATRNTPAIQRNPLGRKGDPTPTSLLSVLDEIGLEGRRQGLVPGYKPGQLFQENGDWAPHVGKYIDELIGGDVARRLDAYATMRKNNQFPPGVQGLRDLRTAVREAAQNAERPPYPGVPRKKEAAALRRIEAALTEDMYRFMGEAGPKGLTAAHLWKSTDRSYGQDYIQELRKPLAKIYGDNVPPVEALNRLTQAAIDGDLRMLRSAMRVAVAKGDKNMLAMGVIANVTKNAQTLDDFVKGMGKIPRDARAVLAQGEDVSHMLRQLGVLEGIARKLSPYDEAIRGGGVRLGNRGPDLSNPANIAFGVAALGNLFGTMLAVGGSAAVVRFMASPRYLTWLTRGAQIKDRTVWNRHMQTLIRFADSDKEKLGEGVVEAIRSVAGTPANAQQPARRPELPGMMRLGGPKPITGVQAPPTESDFERAIRKKMQTGDDNIVAKPDDASRIGRAQRNLDGWLTDLDNEVPDRSFMSPGELNELRNRAGPLPITFSRRAVSNAEREDAEAFRGANKDRMTPADDPDKGSVEVPWYEALFRDKGILPEALKKRGDLSWLKEIDDSEVPVNEEALQETRGKKEGIPLESVVPHHELFDIIPELKGIKVRIGSAKKEGAPGSAAFYDVESKEIVLDEREWARSKPEERRSVLFHELQHAVDDHEGLPFAKLSELLADTTGYRSSYDDQMRRERPPMQIYDHRPSQYIDDVPQDPRLIEGWRSHGRPIRDRAVTGNRRPPGMMNLGGPKDEAGNFAGSPFNEMFAAAAEKGVDYQKASPQEVIDAAWAAKPTDSMAEVIEKAARRLNLNLPWQKRK